MQTQTEKAARTFRSALVGWCRDCGTYDEPYRADTLCLEGCFTDKLNARRLVKRRLLICLECTAGFFDTAAKDKAEEHECEY